MTIEPPFVSRPVLDAAVLNAAEWWLTTRPLNYTADDAEMRLALAVRDWIDNHNEVDDAE